MEKRERREGGRSKERSLPASPFPKTPPPPPFLSFPFLGRQPSAARAHPSLPSLTRFPAPPLASSPLGRKQTGFRNETSHLSKIYEAEKRRRGSNPYTVELDLVFLFLSFSLPSLLSPSLSLSLPPPPPFLPPRQRSSSERKGKKARLSFVRKVQVSTRSCEPASHRGRGRMERGGGGG